jgi:hypothetical protein
MKHLLIAFISFLSFAGLAETYFCVDSLAGRDGQVLTAIEVLADSSILIHPKMNEESGGIAKEIHSQFNKPFRITDSVCYEKYKCHKRQSDSTAQLDPQRLYVTVTKNTSIIKRGLFGDKIIKKELKTEHCYLESIFHSVNDDYFLIKNNQGLFIVNDSMIKDRYDDHKFNNVLNRIHFMRSIKDSSVRKTPLKDIFSAVRSGHYKLITQNDIAAIIYSGNKFIINNPLKANCTDTKGVSYLFSTDGRELSVANEKTTILAGKIKEGFYLNFRSSVYSFIKLDNKTFMTSNLFCEVILH